MSQVPTTNINALYTNTSTGTIISPTIMDSAIQDIVATINTNDSTLIPTAKIALLAITAALIANNTITAAQIANATITSVQLALLAVANANLAAGIDAVKLADGSVTNTVLQFINTLTSNAQTQLDAKIPLTQKAVANGVATLDAGVKIPIAQLPDAIVGALQYQGTWNASTNTPTLTASPTTIKGYFYIVSVAGTQFSISFDVGDWIVSNGTIWQKVDNTDAVPSVFGRLGAIVAATNDYTWAQINKGTSSIADIATRSASDLNTGTLPVGRMPTAIPAINLATGAVDDTHLNYLADVTSLIQAQLNAKAPLTHVGSGGSSQHPDATTSQSGFISVADLIAFRALQATTGLSAFSIPVGQVFPWWSKYSHEQDTNGEWVIYEI